MEYTALLHIPETEYAFLDSEDTITIRFRSKVNDLQSVELVSGDPYLINENNITESLNRMTKIYSTSLFDFWEIKVIANHRRIAYAFLVNGIDGEQIFYCDRGIYTFEKKYYKNINFYFKLPYFHLVDMYRAPEWVENTVWYQIFPDRFHNGNTSNDPEGVLPWNHKNSPSYHDYYGGDLQGIIDKLDYIRDLGFTGIYLTPIFKANTNHKYDSENYLEIDPDFGDEDTLRKLVDEAHKRNIKIMLDGVFNHIGYHSRQWQDVLINQEKSDFKNWFHIHKFPVSSYNHLTLDEIASTKTFEYDTFAFAANMPKLNTTNNEVQKFILDILEYWTVNFGIDAWRFDVANEVDHQFWKKVHHRLTGLNPEIYILGEAWHSARKWLSGDEFHAVMNYPLTDPIKLLLFENELDTFGFRDHVINQFMTYKDPVNRVQFNLLDSHDTERILNAAEGNKDLVKAALFLMYSLGGTPCIYYGTEVGLSGSHDPDNRKCMPWDEKEQDLDMFEFIKRINTFRLDYSELINYSKMHFTSKNKTILEFYKQNEQTNLKFTFNLSKEVMNFDLNNQKIVLLNQCDITEEKAFLEPMGFIVTEQKLIKEDKVEIIQ
ncbi:glycoside hydrolase family 13 protein [Fundicoccus sp. Sow4_D5]|uniref:glycoside hydrolase family 13 protein n=1 Tax=Fundicoccus sp. Sow4_D5 TaxID=3438782 RepID=UPI003F903B8A